PVAVGDVLQGAVVAQDLALVVAHGAHREPHPDDGAVEPAHPRLEALRRAGADERLLPAAAVLGVLIEVADVGLEQRLKVGKPEDLHQRAVGVEHDARRGGAVEADGHAFEQTVVPLLRFAERALRQFALGDVGDDGEGAHEPPLGVEQPARHQESGDATAVAGDRLDLVLGVVALAAAVEFRLQTLTVGVVEELGTAPPQHLVDRVAQHRGEALVDVDQPSLGVAEPEAVRQAVDDQADNIVVLHPTSLWCCYVHHREYGIQTWLEKTDSFGTRGLYRFWREEISVRLLASRLWSTSQQICPSFDKLSRHQPAVKTAGRAPGASSQDAAWVPG